MRTKKAKQLRSIIKKKYKKQLEQNPELFKKLYQSLKKIYKEGRHL